jgi:hypothetical protein
MREGLLSANAPPQVVRSTRSPRRGLPLLSVVACLGALALGCTQANPAHRPSGGVLTDGPAPDGVPVDFSQPVDAAPLDVSVVADGSPAADLAAESSVLLDAPPEPAVEASAPPLDAAPESARDASIPPPVDVAPDVQPDSSLSLGLVARYALDGLSGSSIPDDSGTLSGSPAGNVTWPGGFPAAQFPNGASLGLDGSSAHVVLPAAVIPNVSAEVSISLWFYLAVPSTGFRRTLLSFNNSSSAGIQVGLERGTLAVWPWRAAEGSTVVEASQTSSAGWTHLVYTHRAGTHVLHVNGSLVDSGSFNYPSAATTQVLLGAYAPAGGEMELWAGRIDELRIYNRILSAGEISTLFAGQR